MPAIHLLTSTWTTMAALEGMRHLGVNAIQGGLAGRRRNSTAAQTAKNDADGMIGKPFRVPIVHTTTLDSTITPHSRS